MPLADACVALLERAARSKEIAVEDPELLLGLKVGGDYNPAGKIFGATLAQMLATASLA